MVLGYARSATLQLQGQRIDIMKGLQEVSTIIFSLQTERNDSDTYHNGWFEEAVDVADSVGAIVFSPRLCNRQVHRNNVAADDVSTYFKRNLTMPFIDHFLHELCTRFADTNCIAYTALSIVPAVMIKEYSSKSQEVICSNAFN